MRRTAYLTALAAGVAVAMAGGLLVGVVSVGFIVLRGVAGRRAAGPANLALA